VTDGAALFHRFPPLAYFIEHIQPVHDLVDVHVIGCFTMVSIASFFKGSIAATSINRLVCEKYRRFFAFCLPFAQIESGF
jgi:hypothetical protein